jgi:hypothetical protein
MILYNECNYYLGRVNSPLLRLAKEKKSRLPATAAAFVALPHRRKCIMMRQQRSTAGHGVWGNMLCNGLCSRWGGGACDGQRGGRRSYHLPAALLRPTTFLFFPRHCCPLQMNGKEEVEEEEGGIIIARHHSPACIIGVDGRRGGGRGIVVIVVVEPQRQ